MRASNGDTLNCGEPLNYDMDVYYEDVAAGVLLGAQGKTADIIDSLGFLWLASPVTNVDVTDLTFPNGPTGSQGITPQTLASGHYYNSDPDQDTTWNFSDAKAVTTTYTYTQTSTNTYSNSATVSFTASIPIIGGFSATAGTTFTWMYAETYTNTVTNTDTKTITWGQSGTLAPNTGVDCAAVVGEGAGTYPYTSTVTLQLANGQTYTFPEAGSLKFSDVFQAIVEVTADSSA